MSDSELAKALAVLKQGGVVCIPTESSYGLAVDAANPSALSALQLLKKGRELNSPFGLIADSIVMVRAITALWPKEAEALAMEHWPGPMTLILPPAKGTLSSLIGPSGGLGVRVSSDKNIRSLVTLLGRPITATSANPSGKEAATKPMEARQYFGDAVQYYWEGGECKGEPSTLIDFDSAGYAKVVRKGPIALS